MKTTWPMAGCRIVGAMAPAEGKGPFDRAEVVVEQEAHPGQRLRVRAYLAEEKIEGEVLDEAAWRTLVESEQALEWDPLTLLGRGARMWLLRPAFVGRKAGLEELRASGVLLSDVRHAGAGSWHCLVREPEANRLREDWARRSFDEALRHTRAGRFERAHEHAEMAFALELAASPERWALLILLYEKLGRKRRAAMYLDTARRSWGKDFAERVELERRRLAVECAGGKDRGSSGSAARSRYTMDIRNANRDAMQAALDHLKAA